MDLVHHKTRNHHVCTEVSLVDIFHTKLWKKPSIDVDGYPMYRRRDDGRVIKKGDLVIDNRFVVLFNKYLLMRYNAHITIEWCN